MAIEVTTFSTRTAEENKAEVKAWLTKNASEYFDEITDGTKLYASALDLNRDGKLAIRLDFATSNRSLFNFYLKNEQSKTDINPWATDHKVNKAVKTSHGIYLYSKKFDGVFVSKDREGNLVICAVADLNGNLGYWIGNFEKSNEWFELKHDYRGDDIKDYNEFGVYAKGKTCLVPIVFTDNEMECENLFIVPFTQFLGSENITFELNETKYFYNGIFALKE